MSTQRLTRALVRGFLPAFVVFLGACASAPSDGQGLDAPPSIVENASLHANAITGPNAADVAATVTGGGSIDVDNSGGHVTATLTGTGNMTIVNEGGPLTATNTGNGQMTIHSTATGAVTVTNTGSGRVTVNATGAAAIAVTHSGDEDFTYTTPTP